MTIVLNGSVGIPTSSLSGVIPDANAPSGSVVQVVSAYTGNTTSTSSTSPIDTDLSASITPNSSNNKIIILLNAYIEIGRAHV